MLRADGTFRYGMPSAIISRADGSSQTLTVYSMPCSAANSISSA